MSKNKRVLVIVEWNDAWSSHSWCEVDYYATKPSSIKSVGWLLDENKLGVKISARMDLSGGDVGNVYFIPKACITRPTRLGKYSVVKT
jgi:hypothetical protein